MGALTHHIQKVPNKETSVRNVYLIAHEIQVTLPTESHGNEVNHL